MIYQERQGEFYVALRKESVDRNTDAINLSDIPANVALRKESVDRNCWPVRPAPGCLLSLSARRAWIEMINSK